MENIISPNLNFKLIKPVYDEITALLPVVPERVDAHAAARAIESEDPALKSVLPWVWGCFRGPELMLRLNGVKVGVKLAACGIPAVLANFQDYQRVLTQLLQEDIQASVGRNPEFRQQMMRAPITNLRPVEVEDRARLHFAASQVGVSVAELHSMIFRRTLH